MQNVYLPIVKEGLKMNDSIILNKPEILTEIEAKSKEIGFSMPSDYFVGSLLKALIFFMSLQRQSQVLRKLKIL